MLSWGPCGLTEFVKHRETILQSWNHSLQTKWSRDVLERFIHVATVTWMSTFLKHFWRILVLLSGHWYPRFGLLMTFALGFKARVDFLACMLHYLCAIESSDSPLVQQLLTSWQPAWQPRCSYQHICEQTRLKTGINCGCHCLKLWDRQTELCRIGHMN